MFDGLHIEIAITASQECLIYHQLKENGIIHYQKGVL